MLGSGEFGVVTQGWLCRESCSANTKTRVAVKTVKPNVDVEYFLALLSEVKVMAYLEEHENVVKFMGAWIDSIRKRQIYVAVEFCSQGSLLSVLRRMKTSPGKMRGDSPTSQIMLDKQFQLHIWSRDIANGLAYISSKNVIHGDLAARNVLITAHNVAKISDYGLSRVIIDNGSIYTKKSRTPLPWKWLAPESLESLSFGLKSDVWAYGVTIWEIYSLGNQPYAGCNYDGEFIRKLKNGYRLPQPEMGDEKVYQIMKDCWDICPTGRPTIEIVRDGFQKMITTISSESYVDVEN